MIIGVPKEIIPGEKRVAVLPETAARLVEMGFGVEVESGAGEGAFASDQAYEEAGASIVDAGRIWADADIVVKVKQPDVNQALGRHEAELIRPGAVLVTFLHPAAPSNHDTIKTLAARNVVSFTMDGIPRTSRAQSMDALTSMSTVTGYKSVLLAAAALPKFVPLVPTNMGMLTPAEFLIVGCGVVGLQAIATAKRLGGSITAVETRAEARDAAKSLGAKIGGFDVPEDIACGEGGYAKQLSESWLKAERELLLPLVAKADIVITSALVPGEVAPILFTDEMVAAMQPGAVLVDVSVDQGGNCSATVPGQIVDRNGCSIYGILNIPGSVPVHASRMYAHNLLSYLENMFKNGPGQIDWDDDIVQASLVTKEGAIHHEGALKAMAAA